MPVPWLDECGDVLPLVAYPGAPWAPILEGTLNALCEVAVMELTQETVDGLEVQASTMFTESLRLGLKMV